MTEREARKLLRDLREHYGEPVMPIGRYCEALATWGRCIEQLWASDGDEAHGAAYARHAMHISIDITKSNLLYRLLYLGEPLRQQKCPIHSGHWSGYPNEPCPHGCGHTGWLPEQPTSRRKPPSSRATSTARQRRARTPRR